MKDFDIKKKILIAFVGAILAIFIVWYSYFYSPDYNFITEDDSFLSGVDTEESANTIQNNNYEEGIEDSNSVAEDNLIAIHIARSRKGRRCC